MAHVELHPRLRTESRYVKMKPSTSSYTTTNIDFKYEATAEPVQDDPLEKSDGTNVVSYSVQSVGPATARNNNGWRGGIKYCIAATFAVLIANIAFAAWAFTRRDPDGGSSILYRGSCTTTSNYSTVAHAVINAVSTILIGAGNYCMHIAVSPTRQDIDFCHAKKVTLDVGLNSISNLFKIGWKRRIAWMVLASTSIPLHLVFNSVILSTKTVYTYTAATVDAGYLRGHPWNASNAYLIPDDTRPAWNAWIDAAQLQNSSLQRLDNEACLTAYTKELQFDRANLLLVTAEATDDDRNNSMLGVWYVDMDFVTGTGETTSRMSYDWLCTKSAADGLYGNVPGCDVFTDNPEGLSVIVPTQGVDMLDCILYPEVSGCKNVTIEYCLSQQMPELCTIEANSSVVYMTAVLTFIKLCCMLWVLCGRQGQPFTVLGDAVASFLETPDPTTQGACLLPAERFKNGSWQGVSPWNAESRRWGAVVSARQWIICCVSCIIALLTAAILFAMGIATIKVNNTSTYPSSTFFQAGFSGVDPRFLLALYDPLTTTDMSAVATLPIVLVANLPQLIVSFLYFAYNGVFSRMLMAAEWSRFAKSHTPLRVSFPVGEQRSTYRLQLPYRYGVPLMLLITTIHFLVSESLFLVRIRVHDFTGEEVSLASFTTCGYSLYALLCTMVLGAVALLVLGGFGVFGRIESGMPLVDGCSAVISAACHPRSGESLVASELPLRWEWYLPTMKSDIAVSAQ